MSNHSNHEQLPDSREKTKEIWRILRFYSGSLAWMPSRCRYLPTREFRFSLPLNLLFSLASTITAANLYYTYPILNLVADDFHVSYEKASLIPTLMQAGYGLGILFLCPFGDRCRLRPFVLGLVFVTASLWICLCVTTNFETFCAVSFIIGFATVTPQLMIPLASGLAPPARRATAISLVFSGLMLGMLLPRVLSGIVAQYMPWRNIYWTALGIRYGLGVVLWLYMPDYPSPKPDERTYLGMLWSIIRLVFTQPVLAYACLMVFFSNAVFASYWTTLTALLSSPIYAYSPFKIGLFALIGIAPLALVPLYSRIVIDRFVPSFSVALGLLYAIAGVVVGTYTATLSIAGPVIQAVAIDFGVQTASVAYRAAIYSTVPNARNRTNVAYTVSAFVGQLSGTSVGNRLYAVGGWKASGRFNIAFLCAALVVTLMRGPWETHWIGWRGGFRIRRKEEEGLQAASTEVRDGISADSEP